MIAALAMRKPMMPTPRWAPFAVSARRMVRTLTLEHSVVRSDLPVTLFDDLNNPRVSDLAGSASVRVGAAAFPPVHDCSIIPGHDGRDCQGRIISSPVTAAEAQPVVSSLDEMDAAPEYPFYRTPFCDDSCGKSVIPEWAHTPRCERLNDEAEAAEDAAYMAECEMEFLVEAAIAQMVASLPEVTADHDLDLRSDPVHALAEDHIRMAKPNRMRSRG